MTTMNLYTFTKLVKEDIDWLLKQPRSLERDHILAILEQAPRIYYDKLHCHHGVCGYGDCLCGCADCMAAKYALSTQESSKP